MGSDFISGDVITDIKSFHDKFNFKPENLSFQGMVNRLEFLEEELFETERAMYDRNAAEVLDGLIDLIVVAAGTANLMFGHSATRSAWMKVMGANFKKEKGFNAKRPNSDGMDLVKPDGWRAPDLQEEAHIIERRFTDQSDQELEQMHELMAKTPANKELMKLSERVPTDPPSPQPHCGPVRRATQVLLEAAQLLDKKSADYNSDVVKAADYYPSGVDDFVYMIDVLKRNRQTSLLDQLKRKGETYSPNNEDLRDTLIDRINYLALMVEWLDGKTDGKNPDTDAFNRPFSTDEAFA